MSLISIIVPVYNVERYLPKCLNNLINQTFSDIEIICVNDGSTDNSLQILEEYLKKDKRIKIVSQQNKGLAGARNTGIENAQGKYILFVDSDDWLELNACEELFKIFQQNSQIDFIKYEMIPVYDEYSIVKQPKIKNKIFIINEKNIKNISKEAYDLYAWDKIYSKSFIDKHNLRFCEEVRKHEDTIWDFLIYLKSPTFIKTNLKLYNYRQSRSGSIINTNREKVLEIAPIWFRELEKYRSCDNIEKNNKIYVYCYDYILRLILIERTRLAFSQYHTEYFDLLGKTINDFDLNKKTYWYYRMLYYVLLNKFGLLKIYLFFRDIYKWFYLKLKIIKIFNVSAR